MPAYFTTFTGKKKELFYITLPLSLYDLLSFMKQLALFYPEFPRLYLRQTY